MTLHRLTLPNIILHDYEKRGIFPRFHHGTHIMLGEICPLVSSLDMQAILMDAEHNIPVRVSGNPKLSIAYRHLAEKCRATLRKDGLNAQFGRLGKDAAAGE